MMKSASLQERAPRFCGLIFKSHQYVDIVGGQLAYHCEQSLQVNEGMKDGRLSVDGYSVLGTCRRELGIIPSGAEEQRRPQLSL